MHTKYTFVKDTGTSLMVYGDPDTELAWIIINPKKNPTASVSFKKDDFEKILHAMIDVRDNTLGDE